MSKLVFTQALALFCLVAALREVHSQEAAGEAGPEPYSYSYETDASSASEQKDQNGNVVGFYTVSGPDGRSRRVEYTADASGFHAKVVSNEVGMKSSSPANVEVVAEQPSAEQMRQSASYSEYQSQQSYSGAAQQAAAAGVQVAGGPVAQQQKWYGDSGLGKFSFGASNAGQAYGQQQIAGGQQQSAGGQQYSAYGQQASSGQQVYKQQAAGVAGSGQQGAGQYAAGQYVYGAAPASSSGSYYKSQYSSSSSVQPATTAYGQQGVRYQMVAVPYQTVAYQGVPYQSSGVSYQAAGVPYQATGVSYQAASGPYQAAGVVPAAGTVSSYHQSSVSKSSGPYQAASVQAAAPAYHAAGAQKSASSYSGSSNYIVLKS